MIELIRKEDKLKGTPIILLGRLDETRIGGTECRRMRILQTFNDRELKAEVRNLLTLKMNKGLWS